MTEPTRPEVWVNCAVSLDGRLALAGGRPARLSGPEDLVRVQRLRAECDGILVGVGTVLADDPSLRVHWEILDRPPGRSPTRVVLDSRGRLPPNARVLDGSIPTIVATAESTDRVFPAPVEWIRVGRDRVDITALFQRLAERGMRRLLVEGGATVLASVLRLGLFDRMTVFVAPLVIGGTTAPSLMLGPESPTEADAVHLRQVDAAKLGAGTLLTYLRSSAPDPPPAP